MLTKGLAGTQGEKETQIEFWDVRKPSDMDEGEQPEGYDKQRSR